MTHWLRKSTLLVTFSLSAVVSRASTPVPLAAQARAMADERGGDDESTAADTPALREWASRVESARAERRHADTLMLSGFGVGLATIVATAVSAGSVHSSCTELVAPPID